MANDTERPRAGDPPKLDQSAELLGELLEIERNRLNIAVKIEQKRDIVFPETSVIVRDILKIQAMIEKRSISEDDDSELSEYLKVDFEL